MITCPTGRAWIAWNPTARDSESRSKNCPSARWMKPMNHQTVLANDCPSAAALGGDQMIMLGSTGRKLEPLSSPLWVLVVPSHQAARFRPPSRPGRSITP